LDYINDIYNYYIIDYIIDYINDTRRQPYKQPPFQAHINKKLFARKPATLTNLKI